MCPSWHPFALVQILAPAVSSQSHPPASCSGSLRLNSYLGKIKALTVIWMPPKSWSTGGPQQVLANCRYARVFITSVTQENQTEPFKYHFEGEGVA